MSSCSHALEGISPDIKKGGYHPLFFATSRQSSLHGNGILRHHDRQARHFPHLHTAQVSYLLHTMRVYARPRSICFLRPKRNISASPTVVTPGSDAHGLYTERRAIAGSPGKPARQDVVLVRYPLDPYRLPHVIAIHICRTGSQFDIDRLADVLMMPTATVRNQTVTALANSVFLTTSTLQTDPDLTTGYPPDINPTITSLTDEIRLSSGYKRYPFPDHAVKAACRK
jgi:hypothetical protein